VPYSLRAEGMDFLEAAPLRVVVEARIAAPPAAVWPWIAEAATWHEWFPGVTHAEYPAATPPYGVGTGRRALVSGTRYEEVICAWEAERLLAYTITEMSLPLARAQVEATELFAEADTTRARWTLAAEPRTAFKLAAPALPAILGRLWKRAAANLEKRIVEESADRR